MSTPAELLARYTSQGQLSSYFTDKLGIYSVLSYADGETIYDGVTSAYQALNDLIDVLPIGGGNIFFPSTANGSTYLSETKVTISSIDNLILEGNKATLKFNNVSTGLEITSCDNLTIRDMIFDGNNATTTLLKITTSDNVTIENCIFKNVQAYNADNDVYALHFLGCTNIKVKNCTFEDIDASTSGNLVARGIGIDVSGSTISKHINIESCIFDSVLPVTDGDGIQINQTVDCNAKISKCTFIDCAKRGVKAQAPNVTVEHCKFYDVAFTGEHASAITFFYGNGKAIDNDILFANSKKGIYVEGSADLDNVEIVRNKINITTTAVTTQDAISIGTVNDVSTYTNIDVIGNKIYGDKYRYGIYLPHGNKMNIEDNFLEDSDIIAGLTDQSTYPLLDINIVRNTIKKTAGTCITLKGSRIKIDNNNLNNSAYGINVSSASVTNANCIISNNIFNTMSADGFETSTANMTGFVFEGNIFKSITASDIQLNGSGHIVSDTNIWDKGLSGTIALQLAGSATYDPPSLTTGTETSTTVNVNGASLGDFVKASFSLSTQGIKLNADVTATNTVTVVFRNDTGGTIDLASGTLKAKVIKA